MSQAVTPPDGAGEDVDHDFDAAFAPGPRVRVCGRVYQLPAEPPAKVILASIRARRGRADDTLSTEKLLALMHDLLGEGRVQQMLDDGIGIQKLAEVFRYCMDRYKSRPAATEEDGDQGEAAAPATGPAS